MVKIMSLNIPRPPNVPLSRALYGLYSMVFGYFQGSVRAAGPPIIGAQWTCTFWTSTVILDPFMHGWRGIPRSSRHCGSVNHIPCTLYHVLYTMYLGIQIAKGNVYLYPLGPKVGTTVDGRNPA